jgi:hypothetical protein
VANRVADGFVEIGGWKNNLKVKSYVLGLPPGLVDPIADK